MCREVWLTCPGIPLHVWTDEFFKDLVRRWGSFLGLASETRLKSHFDIARFAILTPILKAINSVLWVKIDEEVFPISVAEEPLKVGDLSAPFRAAKEGVFVSLSSLSTSVSIVPNSLANFQASEQQPTVTNASMVVDDLSKFKPKMNVPADGMVTANGRKLAPFQESTCRSKGAGRASKPNVVEVSKPLGWQGKLDRSVSFSFPGPERQLGGPSCSAH
ncbi:hypothetical protein Ancab_016885, partial [Ancistrocladus abbreviatus]